MSIIKYCNRIIEYSFYALFLLVPIVFSQYTSELFELNKMWLTFGLTIIITSAWIIKMISAKKFLLRRTFFDIPILLFFLSQFISSISTLDPHVSWWGYYSRFNGGFYSTICYILLYYAFLTNLSFKELKKSLYVTLLTGALVALWGLPAHFGKDPTCLLFRGTFDVSCWTDAFQPTVRIFSTLGQPAWMAAYLAFLIPITIALFLTNKISKGTTLKTASLITLAALFYLDLVFANTRAGFIAFWIGNIAFWAILLLKKMFLIKEWVKYVVIVNLLFLLLSFFFGFPIPGMDKLTLPNLMSSTAKSLIANAQTPIPPEEVTEQTPSVPATEEKVTSPAVESVPVAPTTQDTTKPQAPNGINITDSGEIRQIVWQGAIDSWKQNPLFGTGVETFAFAYYKSRPTSHNLTSEWDFLYNKAHNEYLNYLTTTGIFGLGSYLLLIAFITYLTFIIFKEKNTTNPEDKNAVILAFSIFTGFLTILISNFFGFSVVIINIFFFMSPAFLLLLHKKLHPESNKYLKDLPEIPTQKGHDAFQITGIILIIILCLYMISKLLTYWYADKAYALGYNLNRVGEYEQAYNSLSEAVAKRPTEPVFKDELALNLATIATALSLQGGDPATATQAAEQAIALSNETTQASPNNIVFWKNRVKIFFLLNQSTIAGKEVFNDMALESLKKVNSLAPSDAKVLFNLGTLLKTKDLQQAIQVLEETVRQKPDYTDAYRELGKTYQELAERTTDPIQKQQLQTKAREAYEKVIEQNPNDTDTKDLLKSF